MQILQCDCNINYFVWKRKNIKLLRNLYLQLIIIVNILHKSIRSFSFTEIMKLIIFACLLLLFISAGRLNMIDDDNLTIHFPTALKSIIFLRSYNSHYAAYLSDDKYSFLYYITPA